MPENLTPEEQKLWDIDYAKAEIKKNVSALIGLTSLKETSEFINEFTVAPF